VSATSRYTGITGRDEAVSAVALDAGRIGLMWSSDRAVSLDLWFGVPGSLDDVNPPPHYESSSYEPDWVTGDDEITMRVTASDDEQVAGVWLQWALDGETQSEVLLYDDGIHDDGAAGDGLYVGTWASAGIELVTYRFRITDYDGTRSWRRCRPRVSTCRAVCPQPRRPAGAGTAGRRTYPGCSRTLRRPDRGGYGYDLWSCATAAPCPPHSPGVRRLRCRRGVGAARYGLSGDLGYAEQPGDFSTLAAICS
jgi:hypothetical protein